MSKFISKQHIIEAEQWFPDKPVEGVVTEYDPEIDGVSGTPPFPFMRIPNGKIFVNPGDWIITYPSGRKVPHPDYLFQKMYDPYEEKGDQHE